MGQVNKGLASAAAAFTVWGLYPLYFHLLYKVSAFQTIAHRIVWSCLFVLAWLAAHGQLPALRATLAYRGVVWRLVGSGLLICLNWLVYVWAVTNGHVVEASLGYFIVPLINVLLGVVVLSETLNSVQWFAVALVTGGVVYLTVMAGGVPWIALTLAFSFGTYGLIRKTVKVDSLLGLSVETLLLAPFAAAYLLWCGFAGTGALGHSGYRTDFLLIGSGPLTAITLFLFAYGARLLPFSTVGLLQYISPTLQFVCGVVAFHEAFEPTRALGFAIIWAALLIYTIEGLRLSSKVQRGSA